MRIYSHNSHKFLQTFKTKTQMKTQTQKNQMVDILFSYEDTSVFEIVEKLKCDIEKSFDYTISLDSSDEWEESSEFQSLLDKVTVLIMLETNDSAASAWITTDIIKKKRTSRRVASFPPCIDFSDSYEEGLKVLTQVLEGRLL